MSIGIKVRPPARGPRGALGGAFALGLNSRYMEEGLYTAVIGAPPISFAAIVLKNGRILGGDAGFYFVGNYGVTGSEVRGEAIATWHGMAAKGAQSGPTIYGDTATAFRLEFTGRVDEGVIGGTITRGDMPGVTMPLTLLFRSSQP